jgi:hypothetical protein
VYKNQRAVLPMVVVDHVSRPTLLGRNWLERLKLDWGEMLRVENTPSKPETGPNMDSKSRLDALLTQYSHLFEDSYDGMVGFKAHIRMKPPPAKWDYF